MKYNIALYFRVYNGHGHPWFKPEHGFSSVRCSCIWLQWVPLQVLALHWDVSINIRALERGVNVECPGQIFYSFGCRLENHSIECQLDIVTIFKSISYQNKSVNFTLVTRGHSKWTCLFMTFDLSGQYQISMSNISIFQIVCLYRAHRSRINNLQNKPIGT